MRKLASTLGFAKKPTKKDLNSGSKVTCEFWSQGETDATSIDLFGQEGDPSPTTLLVKTARARWRLRSRTLPSRSCC